MADAGPNRIARAEPKPPAPVPVVPLRCWRRGRIVAEVAAGSCVRIKCHCNAWTVHSQGAEQTLDKAC